MNGIQDDALLQAFVRDTIRRWRSGERPDADALLKRHPALSHHKGLAIDLIYEEYCLRHEQGDTLVPSTFCERFPPYERSLSKMLAVHEELEGSHWRPAAVKAPWPKVGDSFLGYQIIEALGRGSLARVFLAREAAVGNRLVVVKISRHGASEAQMLGKAAHPGIVPILSVVNDKQTGWTVICMPLLGTATGTDLLKAAFGSQRAPDSAAIISRVASQYRPAGVSPESDSGRERAAWKGSYTDGIARFGLFLAEGLQAAHEAGVMHRDIKPSNVLLTWSGQPMLLDFNLSTEIGLPSRCVGGTMAYMAPELMALLASESKSARPFDPRADLFSLGALLYELLTGRLPCKPANAEDLLPDEVDPWLAARQQPIIPPRQLNPKIDPGLEAIVLRCLADDLAERPSSARELAGALRRHLGLWPATVRRLHRRRREILVAMLAAAALVIGSGVYVSRLPPLEERLYQQGLREFDRGQFASAEQTFARCLKRKPEWPEAHFARGQALRMAGDCAAARTEFLTMKGDQIALGRSLAGYCDLALGNTVAAESDYALAIQAGANDPISWTNYGYCHKRNGSFQQAIECFDKALAANPNLAIARCHRALARFQQSLSEGEPVSEQSLADIREACRLDPRRADFHFHAAAILSIAMATDPSHKDEALSHLRRSLELGYPRQAVERSGMTSLVSELPPKLLSSQPTPASAAAASPLVVSPLETADLGGFVSS